MALFSGETYSQYQTGRDQCPVDLGAKPNLAAALLKEGFSFAGYSEGLPSMGATVCRAGPYARKHCPWVNFQVEGNVPATCNLPFSAFPKDFKQLPTIAWVIPNLDHDMHDGSPEQADSWLKKNLSVYADWCMVPLNKSLLIIQWDEDDKRTSANQIPTIFCGAGVLPGKYPETINHYTVLSTLLEMFGLKPLGQTAGVAPLRDIFENPVDSPARKAGQTPVPYFFQ